MQRSQSLIIFDFDDTVFPTSWLFENLGRAAISEGRSAATPDVLWALALLTKQMSAMLDAALGVSEVLFITNAAPDYAGVGWVQHCVQHFMPELMDYFEVIRVVYAREAFRQSGRVEEAVQPQLNVVVEGVTETLTMAWKVEAMKQALSTFYGDAASWKNVMSVGDSLDELDALTEVAFLHENAKSRKTGQEKKLRCKAVKLKQEPTLQEMIVEGAIVKTFVSALVNFDGDKEVYLELKPTMCDGLRLDAMDVGTWRTSYEEIGDAFSEALSDPEDCLTAEISLELAQVVFGQRLSSLKQTGTAHGTSSASDESVASQ